MRNWWEWEKSPVPCNDVMGRGRYISFSLLIVTFLRVSSSETLSSLSFHNEIHSFSVHKSCGFLPVLHSSGLLQRPPCYDEGSGVTMKVSVLSPRRVGLLTSDPFTGGNGEPACQITSWFSLSDAGEFS